MSIWRRRRNSARAFPRCCWTGPWRRFRAHSALLGSILHREDRAETLARFAEALLAIAEDSRTASLRVVCARGADGLTLVAPGTDLAETFTRAGWQLVAPAGQGPSRQASLDDIRALDPDVLVFTDPAMRATLAQSDAWQSLRAVREGHAFVAPNMPFGWLDEPPSINRLLGFAWLGGSDPQNARGAVQRRGLRPRADRTATRRAARRRPAPCNHNEESHRCASCWHFACCLRRLRRAHRS